MLPDDFLGNQIERRKALDRADEQTPGLRVRGDAADVLGRLSFCDRPRRDALDEFVFVVDIEDEDADALILDQASRPGYDDVQQPSGLLGRERPGEKENGKKDDQPPQVG